MRLLALGLGDCARHLLALRPDLPAAGTARDVAKVLALREGRAGLPGRPVEAVAWDGGAPSPALLALAREAEAVLVSAPPGEAGCPALLALGEVLAASGRLRLVQYLSTVGVYGDRGGAWVGEGDAPAPASARARRRLAAEGAWAALAARAGAGCQALRLPGLYGPGRNALLDVAAGTARRVVKPGQWFNRAHVADVAGALALGLERPGWSGALNVADDAPAPQADVVAEAARLLGAAPPPEVPFEHAGLSPMALTFWSENRRVSNAGIKRAWGWAPAFPTYREGLAALLAAGEGRGVA